jgi:hypothetical protein
MCGSTKAHSADMIPRQESHGVEISAMNSVANEASDSSVQTQCDDVEQKGGGGSGGGAKRERHTPHLVKSRVTGAGKIKPDSVFPH